jgi:hypothetical protein
MHKVEGPSKIRPNPIKLRQGGSAKAEGAKKQNAGKFEIDSWFVSSGVVVLMWSAEMSASASTLLLLLWQANLRSVSISDADTATSYHATPWDKQGKLMQSPSLSKIKF